MEIQQKNKIRGREAEGREENTTTNTNQQQRSKEEGENLQYTKQQQAAAATASPAPSATSSPSHEFSFTISLLSSSTANPNKAKSQQPPLAIDLTPADDIFFHGHLLPLHLLPNLPVSPRSSTNSLDSFTLPIRELLIDEDRPHNIHSCICSNCDRTKRHSFNSYEYNKRRIHDHRNKHEEEFPTKERVKSKSFSLFGRARKRKEGESKGGGCEDQGEKQKKKLGFDVSHFLKKYISMFSKGRREDIQLRQQPYSFSGKLTPTEGRRNLRGRIGEFSAPASMRTSPTNSGILMATSRVPPPPSSDSTMEELQAAIQAAIAHCKNSIAVADKLTS